MSPELFFAVLVAVSIGVIAGIGIEKLAAKGRRQAWLKRNRHRSDGSRREAGAAPWSRPRDQDTPKQPDAADQLRIVMSASYTIQPLLNKSEARVFKELDRVVLACNPTWHVMAQVSLGEILRSRDPEAYSCINSKRVDLLLVDGDCQPRHAIEYQGGSHHQGTAAARDAIKKEALRRAGIGYHEVVAGQTTPADLRQLIEKLVDRPVAHQR